MICLIFTDFNNLSDISVKTQKNNFFLILTVEQLLALIPNAKVK